MVDRVVGDKPLPANVRKDIIERTEASRCSLKR